MDKMTNLLVHLAMCPGDYQTTCEICRDCSVRSEKNCKQNLKEQVMQLYRGESVDCDITCNLERRIAEVLKDMGVPTHLKGYDCLRDAIYMCVEDETILGCITGRLYPELAKRYDATPSRVERAIRHAIETAWDRGDWYVLKKYFGNTISPSKGKSTNSEFISCVVKKLRMDVQQNGQHGV